MAQLAAWSLVELPKPCWAEPGFFEAWFGFNAEWGSTWLYRPLILYYMAWHLQQLALDACQQRPCHDTSLCFQFQLIRTLLISQHRIQKERRDIHFAINQGITKGQLIRIWNIHRYRLRKARHNSSRRCQDQVRVYNGTLPQHTFTTFISDYVKDSPRLWNVERDEEIAWQSDKPARSLSQSLWVSIKEKISCAYVF